MFRPKENFVDVENYEYQHFDDRISKCEKCGYWQNVSLISGVNEQECLMCIEDDENIPNGRGNKERWTEIVKETGKCQFCSPHSGDNYSRKCRSDVHKNKRS